ncbi:hypothetical protein IMSAGC007_01304 [Lachnospiraceae bacterium]|nr:hypothetical protein IMSAGC007_01304 [Lachnospiraceae bacterium]
MFCVKCGSRIDDKARFCDKCGSPVSASQGGGQTVGGTNALSGSGYTSQNGNAPSTTSGGKKPGKGSLAALLILAIVLAAAAGFFVYKAAHKEETDIQENAGKETEAVEAEETQPEAETGTDEQEQADVKAELEAVLGNISYYGDKSKCSMTAEQAAAYAQFIADGMEGKVEMPKGPLGIPVPDQVFWDTPYEVDDTYGGTYLTDRKNVMLADFAEDGNPYLYVYSSMTEDSFEVYGWDGNTVKLLVNQEGIDRVGSYLLEYPDGKVKACRKGSSGAGDSDVEIYMFGGGTIEKSYSLRVLEDGQGVHCIENGEETLYPAGSYGLAYEKLENAAPHREEHTHAMPYTCFYETQPSTLTEMMDGLNQYAVLLNGGTVPSESQAEADAAEEPASPWLIRMKNCTIDVDLSAYIPAEYLKAAQRDTYGDALQRVVSSYYTHPEMLTITQASFVEYDPSVWFISYPIENSDCVFQFSSNDGGGSWKYDYLVNAHGSDYGGFAIIFDNGVPGNISSLYENCIGTEGLPENFRDEKIYRTDYIMGDFNMNLRDGMGNSYEIPVRELP